jgi:hypothetical protein
MVNRRPISDTEWRRIVLSGTVTNPTVGIRLAVSGDAVAMDYGQVEDGAFATSPILTTTASVTRSGDVATMSGNNFDGWYRQTGGTLFVEMKRLNSSSQMGIVIGGSNANATRSHLINLLGNGNLQIRTENTLGAALGGVGTAVLGISLPGDSINKIAYSQSARISTAYANLTTNVGTVFGVVAPFCTQIVFAGVNPLTATSGYLKKVTYFPTPTNENIAQELTR